MGIAVESPVIVQAKTMESLLGENGGRYLRDEVGQRQSEGPVKGAC